MALKKQTPTRTSNTPGRRLSGALRDDVDTAAPAGRGPEANKPCEACEDSFARQRQSIVRDLHDGIGPVNAAISHLAERAIEAGDPAEKNKLIQQISEWCAVGNAEMRSMMSVLEYRDMSWQDIVTEARRFTRLMMEPREIAFQVLSTGGFPEASTPTSQAVSLMRVIKEMLNNTARHSGATEVEIRFEFSPSVVRLFFRDNGTWSGPREKGRGLRHIRQRVAEMGGAMIFKTVPETSFTCVLPANLSGAGAPDQPPGEPLDEYLHCGR